MRRTFREVVTPLVGAVERARAARDRTAEATATENLLRAYDQLDAGQIGTQEEQLHHRYARVFRQPVPELARLGLSLQDDGHAVEVNLPSPTGATAATPRVRELLATIGRRITGRDAPARYQVRDYAGANYRYHGERRRWAVVDTHHGHVVGRFADRGEAEWQAEEADRDWQNRNGAPGGAS